MDDTKTLRRAIEALAANNYRRRYPAELRSRVAAHARCGLAAGATLWEVARSLGMGSKTLERFLEDDSPKALMPVQLIDPVGEREVTGPIVVRGGCGVTVEGLDLEGAATLLRALS